MTSTDRTADADLLDRLSRVSTTSLADASKGTSPLRVLPRELQPVRPGSRVCGRALTVEAHDDLMSMLAALAIAGPRDVLVVSGSAEGAVSGELFASEAQRRGVSGLVIDGYCRDRATLAGMDIAVYARGSVPSAPPARAIPVIQRRISIGTIPVQPGDLVVGDDDGIVIGSLAEMSAVIDAAESIERYETSLRDVIQAGSPLFEHLNYAEHLAALEAGEASSLNFS